MKKVLGTTLLLLLGLTQGLRVSQTRLNKHTNNLDFAEVASGTGVSHTCQYSINRIMAGATNPANVIGTG